MRAEVPRGYWNPRTETMAREELAALQLRKLRAQLAHAHQGSPFWRERMDAAGVGPDDIRSLADYSARFPILRRDEITTAEATAPPYGSLASVDPALGVRHHQTSGTSGANPVRTFDTSRDWAWCADMWCTGAYAMGVRSTDTALVAFGYGLFIGFWGLQYALEKIGCKVIPTGSFDSEKRVQLLIEQECTVLACTPTYALRLALTAEQMGVDLARDGKISVVIASGEPRPEATKRKIEEAFGAFCGDTAGMTEAATIFMFECAEEPGGCHIIESDYIEEVVDPETREACDYGRVGVRLMTSLGREGIQMFRYWTNDLVVKRPAADCSCGRTWDLYQGGIRGRHDDMRKIRGVWFMPSMVEDVVRTFPEIDEFQCLLVNLDALDTLVIQIEPVVSLHEAEYEPLRARFAAEVKRQLSLTPRVELAAPGQLPRFEMKAKRFRDMTLEAAKP
ncbi:MAG TPA: AMP-binding protein [Candidatus Dormibacteraeota bacterium]|nr:AMP-binding protein [Candidatus Dormibacteraeota bacterium]